MSEEQLLTEAATAIHTAMYQSAGGPQAWVKLTPAEKDRIRAVKLATVISALTQADRMIERIFRGREES